MTLLTITRVVLDASQTVQRRTLPSLEHLSPPGAWLDQSSVIQPSTWDGSTLALRVVDTQEQRNNVTDGPLEGDVSPPHALRELMLRHAAQQYHDGFTSGGAAFDNDDDVHEAAHPPVIEVSCAYLEACAEYGAWLSPHYVWRTPGATAAPRELEGLLNLLGAFENLAQQRDAEDAAHNAAPPLDNLAAEFGAFLAAPPATQRRLQHQPLAFTVPLEAFDGAWKDDMMLLQTTLQQQGPHPSSSQSQAAQQLPAPVGEPALGMPLHVVALLECCFTVLDTIRAATVPAGTSNHHTRPLGTLCQRRRVRPGCRVRGTRDRVRSALTSAGVHEPPLTSDDVVACVATVIEREHSKQTTKK